MATREKKLSVSRKQDTPSPLPPKEVANNETPENNETHEDEQLVKTSPKTPTKTSPSLAKKLANKNVTKKLTKKTIAIKLKPIKKNVKIKQKMKAMLNNPKNVETKKKLLKNCVKRKPLVKSEEPPVLEPVLPIDAEKQAKKKGGRAPRIDNYAKKITKPRKVVKKVKADNSETIDEVMNDLTTLIKTGETENEDLKPKKIIKKKENLENTLSALSPAQHKFIEMLDLNVTQIKGLPVEKRRHSIEKFPISSFTTDINNLSVLNNLPRSVSPRVKNFPKLRTETRRSNPYKMRSDSPARILRNGKQRRLKDLELLEGIEMTYKKRRRNCSEFSGSEMSLSKSGYESDSSFSDLSSVHGAENNENKETDPVKTEKIEQTAGAPIKRSMSNETERDDFIDTNSNLFNNKENNSINIKKEEDFEMTHVSPSSKVPEKSIILDIMKQTFNDSLENRDTEEKKNVKTPKTPKKLSTETLNNKKEMEEEAEEKPESPKEEPQAEPLQNGDSHKSVEESPENLAIKEHILQALGLQSLKAAKEAKLKTKDKAEKSDLYTGTLKTVIKINRGEKKKGRNLKMSLQKKNKNVEHVDNGVEDAAAKTKDAGPSTSWKHGGQSSDTAGAHRKSHYSNRSNMDGSSEHTSDGEATAQEGSTKALVIPEKASSFSIHPGRICKDECSYCYGKFGLFDTPCHIAQMKSVERQNKILAAEKHLTRDSCLCDACYRHVDRKANTPSYTNKSYKRNSAVAPGPRQDHCHVLGCVKIATNILRRKWIIKMRHSICEMNIDLDNPGLHSIPICDEHYSALEYLMVCAMCKRRLAKNHVHYLGPETLDLTSALSEEGIPLTLVDKPVVCKLCKYFAAIILKAPEERPDNSTTFFIEYKRRLLHFNDIVPMDEAAAEEPIIIPTKDNKIEKEPVKKRRKLKNPPDENQPVPCAESPDRPDSPSDYMVDYNTLIPSIAMDCDSENEKKEPQKQPRPETVKQAVEISKNMKLKNDKSSDIAVQRLGSNPSISVRQLFPCEEDLPLQGQIEFGNVKERTPEGWEKCTSVIQYDLETKNLWQELQKPYGNQSSFLRHLILLEKYFRNGDLVLAPNASHHSINYSDSVQSRLRAYDNIPTSASSVQPVSLLPFNKPQKSSSGIITSTPNTAKPINTSNIPKSTPITISQLNSPPLIPPPTVSKPKAPPGLISLHPGTNRPVAPLVKVPQSQKIKFPITKNWRPNLIPFDPTKNAEKKSGLVQVISGGKPYHITLEDYKKMCAIKKSFEMKQKRLQEANKVKVYNSNSVLKSKGLVISKTAVSPKREPLSEPENILEKLDKQVEKLESRLSENNKAPLTLPKIPKSLTVIPQTVTRKPSRPSSPVLLITPKPKQITNKS